MTAYYNENDSFAAAWLRELIKEGLIADGVVDERSICDVQPEDLRGFTQVHLFAGVGGWSYALRLAGVPDNVSMWTGSCPCQPFSVAGKRKGTADKRHLWPEMRRLIAECHPATVFGEQVASKDGREWLAGVRADLETLGYGVGAVDTCAAGIGAPHIRQRLYWVADAEHTEWRTEHQINSVSYGRDGFGRRSDLSGLGDDDERLERRELRRSECADQFAPWQASVFIPCIDGKHRRVPARRMEYAEGDGRQQRGTESSERGTERGRSESEGAWEPEPALFPLAHGIPNRVGALRGAGNAIVPQAAAEFVKAYLEVKNFVCRHRC